MKINQVIYAVAFFVMANALNGCATYSPMPLATKPKYAALKIDSKSIAAKYFSHPFNPGDGLDMTEVATLAVVNNRALRVARDQAHVTGAQAFAASLLPDPQLNLSTDSALSSGATSTAYGIGLNYQLSTFITHNALVKASEAKHQQVDLTVLWQEWQTIAQARVLFSRVLNYQQQLYWANKESDFVNKRFQQVQLALHAGNLSMSALHFTLSYLINVMQQINSLSLQHLKTQQQLNSLLGLPPDTKLHLVEGDEFEVPTEANIKQALVHLPQRRPDLLALQAGYKAQDAYYRQAILGQFPAFSLSFQRARDTSSLDTQGLSLSLRLPFINHNKGAIALQKATRKALYDQYQLRLNQANANVVRTLAQMKLSTRQLAKVQSYLSSLDNAEAKGSKAMQVGNLNSATEVVLVNARAQAHILVEKQKQILREERIALLTLLGTETGEKQP